MCIPRNAASMLIICNDTVKYLSTFKHLSQMAERSMALNPLSKDIPGVGSNLAGDIDFHYAFSLSSRSSKLCKARTNKIKHDVHPE